MSTRTKKRVLVLAEVEIRADDELLKATIREVGFDPIVALGVDDARLSKKPIVAFGPAKRARRLYFALHDLGTVLHFYEYAA